MSAVSRLSKHPPLHRLLLSAAMLATPVPLLAQTAAPAGSAAPASSQAAPSDSAMVNLVRLLVQQKLLTGPQGEALMAQAEAEAAQARAAATRPAAQAAGDLPPPAPGTVRVPYIPESVRTQIREELKQEVMAQAQAEGWAAPNDASPPWVRRIALSGDVRVRSQSSLFSKNNSNLIPDFARINQIGPVPILDRGFFIPLLNSTVDRPNRLELRARLALNAQLGDRLEAGIALATGNDNSPISTNASLGGGLGKRDIWLDRAFVRARPTDWSMIEAGRFENPFISTDLLFDEDLRFDGVAARIDAGPMLGDGVTAALRGGAFPLDFGDPNFPQNDVEKRKPRERWLLSGQLELGAESGDVGLKLTGAYHDFRNMRANLSEPCFLYRVQSDFRSGVICSTDNERATFLRKGNTVSPIRDVVLNVPAPAANETRVSPQFVGLVFDYRVLDLNGQLTYKPSDDLSVTLAGNYLRNLAFKRSLLCRYDAAVSEAYPPLNNVRPVSQGDTGDGNVCSRTNPSVFDGGNQGYLGTLTVASSKLFTRGAWMAKLGYRYLESDAVLDAFTDSDFHLGGTNAKGYTVQGKYSPFDGITFGARWLSANEIAGEPFAIDVVQADIEVAF